MITKAFFPCGGGSNLILGTGSENQILCQFFFTKLSKIDTLALKEKSLPTQMDFYNTCMVPHTIPCGYYNFPRSTNKILQ